MNEPFNKLTDAEAERLAMLAEEAGEIVQIVGKILRHGYESYHPDDPNKKQNRWILQDEINDLAGVVYGMQAAADLSVMTMQEHHRITAWQRKLKYSHHQDRYE